MLYVCLSGIFHVPCPVCQFGPVSLINSCEVQIEFLCNSCHCFNLCIILSYYVPSVNIPSGPTHREFFDRAKSSPPPKPQPPGQKNLVLLKFEDN